MVLILILHCNALIKVTFNARKLFIKSFIRQKKLVLADHVPGVQDYSGMSLERLRAALQLLSEVFNKNVHKKYMNAVKTALNWELGNIAP